MYNDKLANQIAILVAIVEKKYNVAINKKKQGIFVSRRAYITHNALRLVS